MEKIMNEVAKYRLRMQDKSGLFRNFNYNLNKLLNVHKAYTIKEVIQSRGSMARSLKKKKK